MWCSVIAPNMGFSLFVEPRLGFDHFRIRCVNDYCVVSIFKIDLFPLRIIGAFSVSRGSEGKCGTASVSSFSMPRAPHCSLVRIFPVSGWINTFTLASDASAGCETATVFPKWLLGAVGSSAKPLVGQPQAESAAMSRSCFISMTIWMPRGCCKPNT